MTQNGFHKDVQIFAPIAVSGARNDAGGLPPPSPEVLCQMLSAENEQLRGEVRQRELAAGTMAAIALSFAQMLVDHGVMVEGDRTVRIPHDLYRRMHGCVITASTEAVTRDGDVVVHIRERADSPGWED